LLADVLPEVDSQRYVIHVSEDGAFAKLIRQLVVEASGEMRAILTPVRDEDGLRLRELRICDAILPTTRINLPSSLRLVPVSLLELFLMSSLQFLPLSSRSIRPLFQPSRNVAQHGKEDEDHDEKQEERQETSTPGSSAVLGEERRRTEGHQQSRDQ
jgi:hypothetical protein